MLVSGVQQSDSVIHICSATFYLYMNGKGQSLENGLSCICQAIGNILGAKATEYKGSSKRNRSSMESDLFFPIIIMCAR